MQIYRAVRECVFHDAAESDDLNFNAGLFAAFPNCAHFRRLAGKALTTREFEVPGQGPFWPAATDQVAAVVADNRDGNGGYVIVNQCVASRLHLSPAEPMSIADHSNPEGTPFR